MKTQQIGKSEMTCGRLAYGNMRSAGSWNFPVDAERRALGVKAHQAALEAGYTLFDTADIYCRGVCEEILGQALRETKGMREQILIATKCSIRFAGDGGPDAPHRYDSSADYILQSCDASLKRMGIETIDLYQLHRPDLLLNPPEVAKAFEQLHRAGKVRAFGLSNYPPTLLAALAAHCPMPLHVNQVEIHLGRLDCFTDGTLDQCLERTITPLSWSPLGGGWIGGSGSKFPADDPRHESRRRILTALEKVGEEESASPTVIALAWLLKHPSGIIPIVGSNNPQHLRDATAADDIELSREQWYTILLAARGKALP